jgi:hypothetical protein
VSERGAAHSVALVVPGDDLARGAAGGEVQAPTTVVPIRSV